MFLSFKGAVMRQENSLLADLRYFIILEIKIKHLILSTLQS
jgi:hypothetical protein